MKKRTIIAAALALAMTLTACGGAAAPAAPAAPAAAPSSEAAAPASGEAAAPAEGNYVDHIVVAIDTMPTNFEPSGNDAPVLNRLVYDELINYDKVKKELQPALATAWEWVSEDATVLHLDLREGVTFHNGNPFTAEDVAYSLDTNVNANIANYYDHCDIKGDYSVDIVLKGANADFVNLLTNTLYAGIKDKESCEADPDNGSAIGTGPWKLDLANTIPGDTIELLVNADYWGEVPVTSQLTLRYISSASSRLLALQNKEVHAMMAVGETDVPAVQADPNLEFVSGAGVGPAKYYYLAFNMTNGAAKDNLYLRQAIARAINNEDVILAVGDMEAEASDGAFWGYDTPFRASASDFQVDLSYNVEETKALVEKAKEEAGGTLPELHITGNTEKSINMNHILIIQEACRQIGIDVVIDESDGAGVNAKTKFDAGGYDMIQYNVPLETWPSGVNRMLVYSTGSNNRALFQSEEISAMLEEATSTSDDARREELYKQVQVYVHDNAIYVPAYYGSRNGAQLAGVEGIVWSNDGYPEFTYARYAQ